MDHFDGKVWLEVRVAAVRAGQVPVLHVVDEVLVERHLLIHLHRGGERCEFIMTLISVVVVGVEEHLVDDNQRYFRRALAPLADLVETELDLTELAEANDVRGGPLVRVWVLNGRFATYEQESYLLVVHLCLPWSLRRLLVKRSDVAFRIAHQVDPEDELVQLGQYGVFIILFIVG